MGGMGGGGKAGGGFQQQQQQPQIQYVNVPTYDDSASTVKAEKDKAIKALSLMKGRQSTILTSSDTLGNVNLNKKQLLSGAA